MRNCAAPPYHLVSRDRYPRLLLPGRFAVMTMAGQIVHALGAAALRMQMPGAHGKDVTLAINALCAVAGDRDLAIEHQYTRIEIMSMLWVRLVRCHSAVADLLIAVASQLCFELSSGHRHPQ
jgi:hypothetical protein